MYLKFVVVLFFQLFSINNSIFLLNQQPIETIRKPLVLPVLPVRRPSMNPNCFQTEMKLN